MNTEERFIDIEIKLARQEDLVETLNQIVYRQQKEIARLEGLCSALARHMKEGQSNAGETGPAHEPPPHY